jgi:hypothetical protein
MRSVAQLLELNIVEFRREPADRFAIPVEQVDRGLRSGARGIVLTNPHNPSGVSSDRDTLKQVAELAQQWEAWLIVDEVYLDFVTLCRGQEGWTAARFGPRVITTSSLTKVYGLGASRVGWMIANPDMIHRAQCLGDHLHVNMPSLSEAIGVAAFRNLPRLLARTRALCEKGAEVMHRWLAGQRRLVSHGSDGAAFELLRVDGAIDVDALCEVLLRAEGSRPNFVRDEPR